MKGKSESRKEQNRQKREKKKGKWTGGKREGREEEMKQKTDKWNGKGMQLEGRMGDATGKVKGSKIRKKQTE